GLFSGFFVLMGVLLTRESAQTWPVLVVACGVAAFMLAGLAYLRLEVGSEGIRYRSFGSNRALRFSEIERAYFETVVNRAAPRGLVTFWIKPRSEEHTSELQSRVDLVCRLLLEKKKARDD